MEIRQATAADAEAIAAVHVASWRAAYSGIVPASFLASMREPDLAERWRSWLAGDLATAVAWKEGELCGFASGGAARELFEGLSAELYTLYLAPHATRRGMGTILFRDLARQLAAAGHAGMYAWVLSRNPATAFYQRMGGVPLGSKPIEIGGVWLEEQAFGWPHLGAGPQAGS